LDPSPIKTYGSKRRVSLTFPKSYRVAWVVSLRISAPRFLPITGPSASTRSHGNHSKHPTTIQPSFSTIRCKTLNLSLITCYSSAVSACTESRSAAMRTRQPSDFFRNSIPTRPNCSPRTHISPLECALAGKHRVLPVFNRNPSHSSPLDATLMKVLLSVDSKRLREKLNPLDATLTKNQGEGAGFLGVQIFSRFRRSHCRGQSLVPQSAMVRKEPPAAGNKSRCVGV
jgi:hypothetical protein